LQLSVTPGTVAKAYSELEHQEVIVTIRGKGAYIAEQKGKGPSESQRERGFVVFRQTCMEMIYMGIRKEELKNEIDALYSELCAE
jgi:Predicted transcriptional regulators